VQKHRRESVVYLTQAIKERVDAFFKQTGVTPTRIIVYRDGVAEGQFAEILKEEVRGLKLACDTSGGMAYDPKITFIIVQKRHHTRFFCSNPRDQCGRAKNVPPGTVVETGVTYREQFDFYLCSHFGIQGTSRPAHYHVLRDDNNFTPDELQAITYQMCHLYARCTRSVSIPAPTYYAHLACARARHHLQEILGDSSDTQSTTGSAVGSSAASVTSGDSKSSEEEMQEAVKVVESMLTKMYFC
jgi:eukaryotic translation initiation factor 2C